MWEINEFMHVKPQVRYLSGPNWKQTNKQKLHLSSIQEEYVCVFVCLREKGRETEKKREKLRY